MRFIYNLLLVDCFRLFGPSYNGENGAMRVVRDGAMDLQEGAISRDIYEISA